MGEVILPIILSILFSMGISLTSSNIGQGLGEALQGADLSNIPVNVRNDIDNFMSAYDCLNVPITQEAIDKAQASGGKVSTSQLASATNSNIADYINTHQVNVTVEDQMHYNLSNGGYFTLGSFYVGTWKNSAYDFTVDCYDREVCIYDSSGTLIKIDRGSLASLPSDPRYFNSCVPYEWGNFKYESGGSLYFDCKYSQVSYYTKTEPHFNNYTTCSVYISGLSAPVSSALHTGKIGAVSVGGVDYEIDKDGSIDYAGTKVPVSAGGVYEIPNVGNYPGTIDLGAYDVDTQGQLLTQILERVVELEKIKEEEKEDVIDTPTDTVIDYTGDLTEFVYNSPQWATVFPFCIPWDFVNGVKLLSTQPQAPRFEIPVDIPAFGMFSGYSDMIVLDLAEYDKYFKVLRWVSTTLFLISLGFVSFKIVKGVGS